MIDVTLVAPDGTRYELLLPDSQNRIRHANSAAYVEGMNFPDTRTAPYHFEIDRRGTRLTYGLRQDEETIQSGDVLYIVLDKKK